MNRLSISLLALLAIFAFAPLAIADHLDSEGEFCEAHPDNVHCNGGGGGGGGGGGDVDNTNQQGQQQGQIGIVSPDISNDQGQQQGQIGINDLDADLSNRNRNNVETSTKTSTKTNQGQKQGQIGINEQGQSQEGFNAQGQGQFGYIDSHDLYEAQDRNPVSSAAPVSASACSSGVSAQGVDLGAALAVTNPYCNLALTAEVARAQNMPDVAVEMVGFMRQMAKDDSEGLYGIRGFMRGVPIAGGLLGWVW